MPPLHSGALLHLPLFEFFGLEIWSHSVLSELDLGMDALHNCCDFDSCTGYHSNVLLSALAFKVLDKESQLKHNLTKFRGGTERGTPLVDQSI